MVAAPVEGTAASGKISETGRKVVTQGVSVVVPTQGRIELMRALRSASAQVGIADLEIIVVADLPSTDDLLPDVFDIATKVVHTGGGRGGAAARNQGVAASSLPWIAFLDDDDEWEPEKLQTQLAAAAEWPDRSVIVSSRITHVNRDATRASRPIPKVLKVPSQPVDAYLFDRRRPSSSRASLYTSTLVCPRGLAEAVPWQEGLARHQDWDWLIRLGKHDDVLIAQVAEPLVRIQVGSSSSISAGSDWRSSLTWANQVLRRGSPRTYVDFVTAQTLRYAISARSWAGCWSIGKQILGMRTFPSVGPIVIACGGFAPRAAIERILTMNRKRVQA